MLTVESKTLELAYSDAAKQLECSVTELEVEIVQHPSKGFLGLFVKQAIIVVVRKPSAQTPVSETPVTPEKETVEEVSTPQEEAPVEEIVEDVVKETAPRHRTLNETILPTSFVTDQDDEDEQNDYIEDALEGMFDDEDEDESFEDIDAIALEVKTEINELFSKTCF